jgi:hypothetical protein
MAQVWKPHATRAFPLHWAGLVASALAFFLLFDRNPKEAILIGAVTVALQIAVGGVGPALANSKTSREWPLWPLAFGMIVMWLDLLYLMRTQAIVLAVGAYALWIYDIHVRPWLNYRHKAKELDCKRAYLALWVRSRRRRAASTPGRADETSPAFFYRARRIGIGTSDFGGCG